MTPTERDSPGSDKLTRVLTLVEGMAKKLDSIEGSVTDLKDNRLNRAERTLAVQVDRVNRLQTVVYGVLGAIGLEGLGLLVLWLANR